MSYDVYIADEWFNYTYNVGKLFHEHMEGGVQSLDGLTGRKAFERLSDCIAKIAETVHGLWRESDVGEPLFCKYYDSENGWGSAIGGILFLANIMAACARHPRHKVHVS